MSKSIWPSNIIITILQKHYYLYIILWESISYLMLFNKWSIIGNENVSYVPLNTFIPMRYLDILESHSVQQEAVSSEFPESCGKKKSRFFHYFPLFSIILWY